MLRNFFQLRRAFNPAEQLRQLLDPFQRCLHLGDFPVLLCGPCHMRHSPASAATCQPMNRCVPEVHHPGSQLPNCAPGLSAGHAPKLPRPVHPEAMSFIRPFNCFSLNSTNSAKTSASSSFSLTARPALTSSKYSPSSHSLRPHEFDLQSPAVLPILVSLEDNTGEQSPQACR